MRFIVLFFDDLVPSRLDPELSAQHFDYLEKHRLSITSAGGLIPPGEDRFCGSLWVIEGKSYQEVLTLVENDPFTQAGLRPNYSVYRWNYAPSLTRKNQKMEDKVGK